MFLMNYLNFLWKNFKFQPEVCNGCHDLMQKAMSFKDFAIVSVKGNDYRIYFVHMSKDKAINLLQNANLSERSEIL